ncbi:DUF2829 domain-containing protein [Desulfosporosinus sp. SB140]|uniref:DUF2829 domain-containing protein n=1 Tax=Desulfosporosinus paludis TaxID=3115649 RepID=UPI00388DE1E1
MEKYIGAKIITAEPMNLGDYNKSRGWTIPENENPLREGYRVIYPDNYVSWSPKEIFEEAYRKTDGMTFGLAIEATVKGFCIAREGWNGKNMHVTRTKLYTPDNIQINNDCLLLFNVTGKYNTWVPSITDIMAEDWRIVE